VVARVIEVAQTINVNCTDLLVSRTR